MRNSAFILTALTFALVQNVEASCLLGEPSRVATVTVTSCSTVGELARVRLGTVDLPWVVTHVNEIVERNKGVVIAGQVTRKIHLEQHSDHEFRFLDVVPSDESDVWFVRGENLSCDTFKPGSVAEIYASDKCCDVFPPRDVPCLLGLAQAQTVGEHLQNYLKAAGLR